MCKYVYIRTQRANCLVKLSSCIFTIIIFICTNVSKLWRFFGALITKFFHFSIHLKQDLCIIVMSHYITFHKINLKYLILAIIIKSCVLIKYSTLTEIEFKKVRKEILFDFSCYFSSRHKNKNTLSCIKTIHIFYSIEIIKEAVKFTSL
jgi:hypothetical protein